MSHLTVFFSLLQHGSTVQRVQCRVACGLKSPSFMRSAAHRDNIMPPDKLYVGL